MIPSDRDAPAGASAVATHLLRDILGMDVFAADGRRLGHVNDLRLAPTQAIEGILARPAGRARTTADPLDGPRHPPARRLRTLDCRQRDRLDNASDNPLGADARPAGHGLPRIGLDGCGLPEMSLAGAGRAVRHMAWLTRTIYTGVR
jgi:hypothetical protein